MFETIYNFLFNMYTIGIDEMSNIAEARANGAIIMTLSFIGAFTIGNLVSFFIIEFQFHEISWKLKGLVFLYLVLNAIIITSLGCLLFNISTEVFAIVGFISLLLMFRHRNHDDDDEFVFFVGLFGLKSYFRDMMKHKEEYERMLKIWKEKYNKIKNINL